MGADITGDVIVAGGALIGILGGFLLNENAKRRHRIEDTLVAAEAAVAAAAASSHYVEAITVNGMTEQEKLDVDASFRVHAAEHVRDTLEAARARLTEVLPYVPGVESYFLRPAACGALDPTRNTVGEHATLLVPGLPTVVERISR